MPARVKADFTSGYNNTLRSEMISQVMEKFMTMLRFVRYNYAYRAMVVFMIKGEVVHIVERVFGTQQGDVLGGQSVRSEHL